ncbi:nucleic acid/nucleotide deaminase domain-containing protein [Streptomyces sp. NPDC059373]
MTNKIVSALEDGAGKLIKTLGDDAGKAVKNLYHDTGNRLKRVSSNHLENDAKHAAELERIAKRPRTEETPIYHVGDDGTIRRLHHDPSAKDPEKRYTKSDLTDDDKKRLGLDSSSIGRPVAGERNARLKRKGEEGYTRPRPQAPSQEVALGSTDLAQATQLARHADKSYGSRLGDGEFQSNNYAAARVRSKDGSGDFVIVGRSNGYRHSERMIGTPFLREGEPSRIREVYTEREPCTDPPSCRSWIAERFPSSVQVSHSVEYGDKESRARGNSTMENYLNQLKKQR